MSREEFLRWAMRLPDALMLVAGDGTILACNTALQSLLSRPEELVVGKTFYDLTRTPPEAVRAALRLWSGSGQMVYGPAAIDLEDAGKFRCEGAVLSARKDSKPALLIVRVKRHEAATERFIALNQTIEKLTAEIRARKKSEEEIRRQREWLHVTLSSIGDAVIATDLDGRVEFMNPPAEHLTGWTRAAARGMPMETVFAIFNEHTGEVVENPVGRVLAERHVVGMANHTVLRAKNGTETPIEDSAAPIRNSQGTVAGVVLVFRDVSEKLKAQAALIASEQRFQLWTELNVIATAVTDLRGTVFKGNDQLLELLGGTRQELAEARIRLQDLTPPEYRARDGEAIAEARTQGSCRPYEKEFVDKSGRRVPVIAGYALFTAPGRYPQQESDELAICFIVDISERKRVEELLERRVAERTARLTTALADLEAFSYAVSHDLRAPLRSMQTYSQFLLQDYGPILNDEAKGFLQKIMRSGEHLDTLIRDVLTFTRVSKEDRPLKPVDLRRLLVELVERYPNLAVPGVQIEIASSLPCLMGNEALLTQSFSNLIGNAVKFVAAGTSPHVKIYGEVRGARVRVWVEDNGIGISQADLVRIFDMFERVHGSSEFEGTGIGLSVVRRAAERMCGEVGVESELGRGSRFWLELPSA